MALLGLVKPLVLFPLEKSHNYTHMAKRDIEVWDRWIDAYGKSYPGVAYDVAVGGLAAPNAEPDDGMAEMWQYDTALKIDAVVIHPDGLLVIEVRPWATTSAIGACLCYAYVLERAGLTEQLLMPAIVCAGIQVDVAWTAEKLGIRVWTV